MINKIFTPRLELFPVTLDITQDIINKSSKAIENKGYTIGDWPTEDTKSIIPIVHCSLEKSKEPTGYEFWIIVKRENNEIIGDIGFHGIPNELGEVEVGYGLVEKERGKGYGYEALEAIIHWALSQEIVKIVTANCLIDNIPSARILQKVGMKEIKRDDDLIYWELIKEEINI